jgi:RNA polymerase-binding protein DksA
MLCAPHTFSRRGPSNAIRRHLLAERRAILARVARAEHELRGLGAVEADEADEAQEETSAALLLRLDDRARHELAAIDAALERLDRHTYGICTACGRRIAAERLTASPEADRCIDCARAAG